MAIAVFSDIHGNLEALEAILNDCKKRGIKPKDIYFCGDAVGFGPNPSECLDLINQSGINACIGNHEQRMIGYERSITTWKPQGRLHMQANMLSLSNNNYKFIHKMPLEYKIMYKKFRLFFSHYSHGIDGVVDEDYEEFSESALTKMFDREHCNVIFFGHVHDRKILINADGKAYVCLGSSGIVKDEWTFYTLFDIKNNNYDIDRIRVKFNRTKFENKFNKITDPVKIMFKHHFGL